MTFLITGADGQLGREWYTFLTDKSVEVTGYGAGELDITDKKELEAMIEKVSPDTIINCAAYTDVDGAEKNAEKAFNVNEIGVLNLSDACFRRGVKLVHYSTDYVFPGQLRDRKSCPSGYPENAPKSPLNVYGASKLAGERALLESGAAYLLIRTSWLCGRFGNNFVKTMLRLAHESRSLRVVNDQFGSPSFTENVVFNSYNLISKELTGTWHVTSTGILSWYEFAEKIFDMAGMNPKLAAVSSSEFVRPAERPSYSKLSTEKLQQVTDATLEDWESGLRKLLSALQVS